MTKGGTLFYRYACLLARTLTYLCTRIEIEGMENVPKSGPLIVAMNHLSIADPFMFASFFTLPIVFMAKEEIYKIPGMRKITRWYGSFTVRRGEPDREAIRNCIGVLQRGDVLGLFPEGTRSKSGYLGEVKAGVGLVIHRTGAPVLPVGITGTNLIRPFLRRPRVQVKIGPPVTFESSAGTARLAARDYSELVMRAIAAQLPEDQRGPYQPLASGSVS